MAHVPHSLSREKVQDALREIALVRRIYFFEEIGSTSDWAKELVARAGPSADLHGTLVVANHQSAGRGRYQRAWQTPAGKALLFSLLLDPHQAPAGWPGCSSASPEPHEAPAPDQLAHCFGRWLSVVCPVAVSEGIRGIENLAARIKYPNDILLGGKKTAGILLEQCRSGERSLFVLGVGINVNQSAEELPREARTAPTSLALEASREFALERVLASVLHRLDFWLCAPRGATAAARMNALCDTVGQMVEVRTHSSTVCGVAMAVSADGGLVVRTESGIEQVLYSGDIEQVQLRG